MEEYEDLISGLTDLILVLQVVERFVVTKPELETDYSKYCFEQDRREKSAILTLAIDKLIALQEEHLKNIKKELDYE